VARVTTTIGTAHRLAIGDVMPEVELPDLDGRTRCLGEFRGRPLLIFMWASW
jgi:hypothetical protein